MTMLDSFLWLCTLGYALFVITMLIGLIRLAWQGRTVSLQDRGTMDTHAMDTSPMDVAVVIPVRNEFPHLLALLDDLSKQVLDGLRLEVIVVDDASTDGTAEAVSQYAGLRGVGVLRCVSAATRPAGVSPKIWAMQQGMSLTEAPFVLATDGDCRVSPSWIQAMLGGFDIDTGMVVGMTRCDDVTRPYRRTHAIQSLELSAYLFIAAGSIGIGHPLSANGNNLAYRRAAYDAIGGYDGIEHIVGGDDDLMAQRIAASPWKVRFATHTAATVYTQPSDTLLSFIRQRVRWISKGLIYGGWLTPFLVVMWLYLVLFSVSLPLWLLGMWPSVWAIWLVKVLVDGLFLGFGSIYMGQARNLRAWPIAELLYAPYAVLVSAWGNLGRFTWKGRVTKSTL